MAATLIALRWRLTINALRKNPWAMVGAVLGCLYGLGLLGSFIPAAIGLGRGVAPADLVLVLGTLGAGLVAGWALVPLLLTGVDATLDPRAMAAWAAPSWRLAVGLLAAGACGLPGIVTGVLCLLPVLTWLVAGQPLAALLALLCAPAALATCVLLSRLVVVSAGTWASRRGREATAVITMILIMACSLAPSLLNATLGSRGAEVLSGLRTLARTLVWSPLGWAFAAPGLLVTGPLWGALAAVAGAWLIPLALLGPWRRLVSRVMTTSGKSVNRSHAYLPQEQDSAGRAAQALDILPWSRRLTRLLPALPPACGATAARCLRYWRSDPRYLVQLVSIVMLPVFLVVMPTLGSGRVTINGERIGQNLGLGQAPVGLLLIVPVMVLMMGWAIHDDIGYDSTAVWSWLSAGVPGWQDILGRALAALTWQAPLAIAVGAGACLWTGRWDAAPALAGGCLALHGCALAWSCLTSVLLPYEVVPPGVSPMSSRTSGTVFLAGLFQMVGMLVILTAVLPVGAAAVAVVQTGHAAWGWLVLPVGLVWGGAALALGVRHAGVLLDRRGPALLATIQSWPGHNQPA